MAISGVLSNTGAYSASIAQGNPKPPVKASDTQLVASTDTVNFSKEAIAFAQQSNTLLASDTNLPLEAFAIPDWLAGLHSDYLSLGTELGISYPESNSARYDSLSRQDKKDLNEYQNILGDYFRKALHDRNIYNDKDYYKSIVQNDTISEKVHQDVQQHLSQNPRAVELMQHFEIF